MPADDSSPQEPSKHHGNGDAPYHCYKGDEKPAIAGFAIDYGYCRHSLDALFGSSDKRCPVDCRYKAPERVKDDFDVIFFREGAQAAARFSKFHSRMQKE